MKIGILRSSVIYLLILCACSEVQKKTVVKEGIEIPRIAFRLITESTVDPCPICARKKIDEAVSILVAKYDVDKRIKSNDACGFTRTAECGQNEFVLTCYREREPYVVPGEGIQRLLPLLVFRFHTGKDHLAGISNIDYTSENYSSIINCLPVNNTVQGEIQIINFQHGDGPSFNYYKEKNQVVVNCRISSLE